MKLSHLAESGNETPKVGDVVILQASAGGLGVSFETKVTELSGGDEDDGHDFITYKVTGIYACEMDGVEMGVTSGKFYANGNDEIVGNVSKTKFSRTGKNIYATPRK